MPNISKDENYFWKKKEFVSFLLSILVFLIHISSVAQYGSSGGFVSAFNTRAAFFLKESITRFAVPMFFMLSGITFFKDYDNKKYGKKVKSRVFTLLIPYLVWNILCMLFDLVCSYTFISRYFVARKPFELTFLNVLSAVFFYKCNGAFWFMFDLIIFVGAAPLIFAVIRNKYIGIASIVALSVLSLFGIKLPASVFYSSNSIIFYLIGALIGRHFFSVISEKSSIKRQCSSAVFLAAYIIAKNVFSSQISTKNPVSEVVVFSLCAFSLWNITDVFIGGIKPRAIYSRSFAVYAMHVNLSAIITKVIFLCLPKSEWLAIPNLVVTLILTLTVINFACIFLEKYFPRVYSICMGRRIKH